MLVAVYAVQEFLEGLVAAGHPGGVHGIVGHGGWWAGVLAVAVGAVIALLLRVATVVVEAVARRFRRTARRRRRRRRSPRPPPARRGRGRSRWPTRAARPRSPSPRQRRRAERRPDREGRSEIVVAVAHRHGSAGVAAARECRGARPWSRRSRSTTACVVAHAASGVAVHVLDGDRALHVTVDPGRTVIVRGYLGEPMIRFADGR